MSFLFIILVATLFIYFSRSAGIADTEVLLSAKKICNELQTSINQAASSRFGFLSQIEIPDRILTKNYTLTVDANNRTVLIKWDSSAFTCPLAYQNVSNGSSSFFNIATGKNNIRTNNTGVVVIARST